MAVDLSDIPVNDYVYNGLTYRDYKVLPLEQKEQANDLVRVILRSVAGDFMCGPSLRQIYIERLEEAAAASLSPTDRLSAETTYDSVQRATETQALGAGLIRIAALQNRQVVSVIQFQNSVITKDDIGTLELRCTVALFNVGLRIWNADTNVTSNYINALTALQRYLLSNPLTLGNRSVVVGLIDPLMKGRPYVTDARITAYLSALDTAMTGLGATLVPLTLGTRSYNGYAA